MSPTHPNSYLPVMIARLMISLKKAALDTNPTDSEWSLGASTILQLTDISFQSNPHPFDPLQGDPVPDADIPLSHVYKYQRQGV